MPAQFRETALFKEVVRPFGIENSLVTYFAREADVMATLAAMRDEEAGPFRSAEVRRLAMLVPHLRRAFEFYALMRQASERSSDLASALDLLDAAVILTDSRLRVAHANRAAEELAQTRTGLSLDKGSLALKDGQCSRRIARAVERGARRGERRRHDHAGRAHRDHLRRERHALSGLAAPAVEAPDRHGDAGEGRTRGRDPQRGSEGPGRFRRPPAAPVRA